MPKLKNQKFYFRMPDMEEFKCTCHINSDGVFYIPLEDFPVAVIEMCTYEYPITYVGRGRHNLKKAVKLENPSQFEGMVERIVRSAENNYKDDKKEKVIAYKIRLNGCILERGLKNEGTDDEYFEQGRSFNDINSHSDTEALGIVTVWNNFYRVKSENERYPYIYYDMQQRSIGRLDDDDWKFMSWSQVREDWFKALDESLKRTIKSAANFRESSDEFIAQFIDEGGGKNLLEFKAPEVAAAPVKKVKGRTNVNRV